MKVAIIGNGFDLDLKLNTRYSDFAKSEQWDALYHQYPIDGDSLSAYLYGLANREAWFDIEKGMADYVKEKEQNNDFSYAKDDKVFFVDLKKELDNYIMAETERNTCDDHSLAAKFLEIHQCFDKVYSFNYTIYDVLPYVGRNNLEPMRPTYVHNEALSEGEIVFGIGENDCNCLEYEFLKKINQSYNPTEILHDLKNADEVLFFGHSLNRIDWDYFDVFFKDCCMGYQIENKRHITMANLENNRDRIRLQLHKMKVNLTKLTNLCKLDYISTDRYSLGYYDEKEKVNNLIKRWKIKRKEL